MGDNLWKLRESVLYSTGSRKSYKCIIGNASPWPFNQNVKVCVNQIEFSSITYESLKGR